MRIFLIILSVFILAGSVVLWVASEKTYYIPIVDIGDYDLRETRYALHSSLQYGTISFLPRWRTSEWGPITLNSLEDRVCWQEEDRINLYAEGFSPFWLKPACEQYYIWNHTTKVLGVALRARRAFCYDDPGIPKVESNSISVHVRVPAYYFTIVSGVFFLIVAKTIIHPMWRRRSRNGQGLCTACGYDLRGSVDRCPECGRRIEEFAQRAGHPFFTKP